MTSAEKLKTLRVQLRLTPEDRDNLKKLAKGKGKNISEYIRWLIDREVQKNN
jgi:predicted DNA-binding protein